MRVCKIYKVSEATVRRAQPNYFQPAKMSSFIMHEIAAINPGSIILVTGVNGLIASHIADQLLAAGYNVRGTVRNLEKCAWMPAFFANRHTSTNVTFEVVKVADMSLDGCFDDAIHGCAGVIHTTSSIEMQASSPEPTITDNVKTVMTCLESAAKESSVQRFVLTSSAWSVSAPRPDTKFTVSPKDWNDQAIQDAYATGTPASNGMSIFMAGKMMAEKECWRFMRERHPGFVFNAVLPETTFGAVLSPEHQGIPSTAGLVRMLFDGQGLDILHWVQPQYFIDAVDCARLHVAALVHPDAKDERFLGHAEPWNWNDVLAMFRKWFPDRQFPNDMQLGRDISTVENGKSLELLRGVYGQERWTSLEESVKANVDSFVGTGSQAQMALFGQAA